MSVTRVLYRERQRLTAADLRLEQTYRLGVAGRHHLGPHEWGIVRGLRVVADDTVQGKYRLTPGCAIDGYGREILVPEPVELEIQDLERAWCVLVAYCEDPEQVPAGRSCREDPAPRVRQRTACVIRDAATWTPISATARDVARATAAAVVDAAPAWPVLVAKVIPAVGGPLVDDSQTRHVGHRGAMIRSPTGHASMQLGLASAADVYQFLLSTRGEDGSLLRRCAIDRDGVVHVWRPLVVSGAIAAGEAPLGGGKVLRVETAIPAGLGRRVRIEGRIDRDERTLSAALRETGQAGPARPADVRAEASVAADEPLSIALPFAAGRIARFDLVDAASRSPAALADAPRAARPQRGRGGGAGAVPPQPRSEAFSIEAGPAGGALRLEPADGSDSAPAVQFRPAAETKADPLLREAHAVTTSKASDLVPATAFRLSGGGMDESDRSARLSIGWRAAGGRYAPALRMDGGGRFAVPGPVGDDGATLHVQRAVHLAAIGSKDPFAQELLPLAFIAGLRRIGKIIGGLTIALHPGEVVAPNAVPVRRRVGRPAARRARAARAIPVPQTLTVVRGQTLEYSIVLTSFDDDVEIKHCLETVTGITGSREMTVRTITDLLKPPSHPISFVQLEHFTHTASKARLDVQMLVKRGNLTGVVVATPLLVRIVDEVATPQ